MTEQATLDFTAPESRADQIFKRFCEFHAANPQIWTLFERFALQITSSARPRYSGRLIFERIRWHVNVETAGDEVKINNDFAPYYTRMFIAKHPLAGAAFALRRRTSEKRPAFDQDLAVFHVGAPGDESALMAQLRTM
jgi:hypothetical protein